MTDSMSVPKGDWADIEMEPGPPIMVHDNSQRHQSSSEPSHAPLMDAARRFLYRQYSFQQVVDRAIKARNDTTKRTANEEIIHKLRKAQVHVFLIRANDDDNGQSFHNETTEKAGLPKLVVFTVDEDGDIWAQIHKCIRLSSKLVHTCLGCDNQRCLLYEDQRGRLFNLTVTGDFTGLASTWINNMASFSGLEAMGLFVILVRAFGCSKVNLVTGIRPGALVFILGLIFTEEISLVWLNVAMLVWGMPSVSAFALVQPVDTDWPRQALLLILVLAGIADSGSDTERIMTMTGVAIGCVILMANLGCRAWRHINLPAVAYNGPFPIVVSAIFALAAGVCMPYLGDRRVQAGGQAALESILFNALMVAIVFVLSDMDVIQAFFVVGSEQCSQDKVNIAVGIWWPLSLLASIFLSKRIQKYDVTDALPSSEAESIDNNSTEPLVVEEQDSPVGYRVPGIPDLKLDPVVASKANLPSCFRLLELLGIVMALVIGGIVTYLGFLDVDDEFAVGS